VVLEKNEGVEALAEHGVDMEEVSRDDALGLRGKGLLPGGTGSSRGRVDASGVQDFPDGRCGGPVSESGQFALNASVSPLGVFTGQAQDEFLDRRVGGWSSGSALVCGVVSLRGDESAVSGQHRCWLDREDVVALAENVIHPGQAAWWYSLRMPPSRWRRRMLRRVIWS
jgi:hypothetical protein